MANRVDAAIFGGCLAGGGVLAAVAVGALVGGTGAVRVLPFGPPGIALSFVLDGLSAWFLLLLGLTVAVASLFALGQPPSGGRAAFPPFIAAMALTILAADSFTMLLGFEAMSLAGWALVAAHHAEAANRRAARLFLMVAAFAGVCLIAACGLLAVAGGATAGRLDFAALRAAPPTGALATAVLLLALLGAGAKAGLAPLHVWLPLAHPAAPSHASALLSGAMTKVALYVLIRLVFDLCGPAQPSWWGLPLIAAGAASAVLGALRANLENDSKALLACSTIENIGLIVLALGLALAFRGADLGPLAALAAGAALLHVLNHGVFKTLLFVVAGAVQHAAGSRQLDRLGGLIHAMPLTAAAALVGAAAAAALPPLSGFASDWLLLQALLAGWHVPGVGMQVAVAAATALAAMAVALAGAAMLRCFGLVFLGRPRTPRGAGAAEPGRLVLAALLLPAGLTVLFGLLPGPLLRLATPAVRVVAGRGDQLPVLGQTLVAGPDGAGYAPRLIGLLLGLAAAGLVLAVLRRAPGATRRGPVWNGGFLDPPAHLVFGDPLTQASAAGLAQPLRRMLGGFLFAARETLDTPPPGDPRPGHHAVGWHDPGERWLFRPLADWRDRLAALAERINAPDLRTSLGWGFGALVGLLALLAWLESR